MKRSNIVLLIMLFVTSSCTEKDVLLHQRNEKTEIKVTSSISVIDVSADKSSRAPFEGYIDTSNRITARILGSINKDLETEPYINGTMTFPDTLNAVAYNELLTAETKSDQQKYYYPNSGSINLFGLYPSDISTESADLAWYIKATNTVCYSFNGKQDLMVAPRIYSTSTEAENHIYKKLEFKHILTLLDIYVQSDPIDEYNGKINEIKLIGCNNGSLPYTTANVLFSDDSYDVNLSNNETNTFPFWDCSDNEFTNKDITVTKLRQKIAYSIVNPVNATAEGNEYKLQIVFDNNVKKEVPINLFMNNDIKFIGSTVGKRFKLILNVHSFNSSIEIKATAIVIPWEEVSENIIEIK